jgi:hypothetical protein
MLAPASSTCSAPAEEYRRRARRLRAMHGHDLGALHYALSQLAQETDKVAAPPPKEEGPAASFGRLVAQQLEGPVLRYSRRQALLREAERRGIGRFEANLIIAAVQHQTRNEKTSRANESDAEDASAWRLGAAACAVQGLIFLAMYLLLFY